MNEKLTNRSLAEAEWSQHIYEKAKFRASTSTITNFVKQHKFFQQSCKRGNTFFWSSYFCELVQMPNCRFHFLIICWLQFSTASRNAIQLRAHCEIIAQNCSVRATVWVQLEIFISCALFVHSLRKDLETIRIWAEKIICESMKIMWKLSAHLSHFAKISWSAQHSNYHYYSIRRTTCYALIIAHNSRFCHSVDIPASS